MAITQLTTTATRATTIPTLEIVTPIRIAVLFIFIGTAYQFAIKQIWEKWRMARIQEKLTDHIVVLGFGISGSEAVRELIARGTDPACIVVIDSNRDRVNAAEAMGCNVLEGDASSDETLIDAFRRGEDIHQQTANRVFGEDSGLDPRELRRRAKIVNYALLYGKTAFTLARDIGVSQQSAQEFIDAYFEGFPAVRTYIDAIVERARETGVVTTMFGRRRLVPELTSRNGQIRAAAERVAVNMPIQGTAADILKRAMIDVHGALPAGARMILTVHDELLFEVPEARAEETALFARERMERAAVLDVPLTVDVGIGQNWKDAKS